MHLTHFGVRRHRASAAADRDIRTIPAFLFVRVQALESLGRRLPPALDATVNMAHRRRRVTREPGADVERAVRANAVSVPAMDLAGTHMDAVRRREAATPRLIPQECHLL